MVVKFVMGEDFAASNMVGGDVCGENILEKHKKRFGKKKTYSCFK